MAQPDPKKPRLEVDTGPGGGSAPSSQHTMEAADPHSQETDMEIPQRSPTRAVWAVVLWRENDEATTARVLFTKSKYEAYQTRPEVFREIIDVYDLTMAAMERAQKRYSRLKDSGSVLVYDCNPTNSDPKTMELGTDHTLLADLQHLDEATPVHNHRGKQGKVVETFYVLVNAQAPQQIPMQITAAARAPQAPLDWVTSNFGELCYCETLKFLEPTADLPRQGREPQVIQVWNSTYNFKDSPRKNLVYVYGTAGVGKTALLRYVAERTDSDLEHLPSDTREWVKQVEVLAVTFSSSTPVQPFDVKLIRDEQLFAPIVARLMFAMQKRTISFRDFCERLTTAYDTNSVDKFQLNSLEHLFTVMGWWSRPSDAPRKFVLLLVDELAKLHQELLFREWAEDDAIKAINTVRRDLCKEMDNKPLQVVFSSLSAKLMDAEKRTQTDRDVVRIELPLLTREQSLNILFSSINMRFQDRSAIDADKARVCALLEILAGGHPRTLEWIIQKLRSIRGTSNVDEIIRQVRADLKTKYEQTFTAYPWPLLLMVLVGENVRLDARVQDNPPLDIDDCVKYGYLINPTVDGTGILRPAISEIQLAVLADVLSWSVHLGDEQVQVMKKLAKLLTVATAMDGKNFEKFHMCWEIVHRNALRMLKNPTSMRICDYYGCDVTTGDLCKLEFEIGPLFDSKPFVPGTSWKHRTRALKEFPPSPTLLVHGRPITCYVWFADRDDFPDLDFVVFVRLVTGKIIALVFQSKYSLEGSSTVLGLAAITQAYRGAKRIMNHAGWGDDEFIFVPHAYRTTAGNVEQLQQVDKDVKNLMVLTKPILLNFYGCVAPSLEFAWFRRDLQAGVQQWDAGSSQFIVDEAILQNMKTEMKTEEGAEHSDSEQIGEGEGAERRDGEQIL